MKFIRDIISEKARQSAERIEASPPAELNSFDSRVAKLQSPLETDLEPADTLLSSLASSETAEPPADANAISLDTPELGKRLDLRDEQRVMTARPKAEPEFSAKSETTRHMDAMKALEDLNAEEEKPLYPDHVQQEPRLDAFDSTEVSGEEQHVETDMSDLDVPNDADELEAVSTSEEDSQDALEQILQSRVDMSSPTPDAVQTKPQPESAEPDMSLLRDASAQLGRSPISKIDQANTELGLSEAVSVPAPAVGRGAARAGRVKTRLLGFNPGNNAAPDPFDNRNQQSSSGFTQFPVGWLIVVDGHGVGSAFTLFDGVSQIGRGSDQTVCLDFGDNSISRENHAVVAYDSEARKFFLGHGGKSNLVRLNNRPVLSTEEIESGNTIRIGETTLRFVGLCGGDFQWQETPMEDRQNVAFS